MTKNPKIDDTLTREERAAPFQIPDVAPEPLEQPTRAPIEIDGTEWIAWNHRNGEVIERGTYARGLARTGGANRSG